MGCPQVFSALRAQGARSVPSADTQVFRFQSSLTLGVSTGREGLQATDHCQ